MDAPPRGTRWFDLSVIDHDAPKPGGWVHLRVAGIAAASRGFDGAPRSARKSIRTISAPPVWGGPCPPPGPVHHYTFTLRALDARGRVLAEATMIPIYKR